MLLFWRIRYLDTRDKQYKDRDLWLDTETLDAVAKAAVETTHGLTDPGGGRPMLRYRHLFREQKHSGQEFNDLWARHGGISNVSIVDYFEDENGDELTPERRGQVLTGDPDSAIFPAGTKQHDIDFRFAPKPNVDLRQMQVPETDLNALAYFSRDLRQLEASDFLLEGPGTICAERGITPVVETSLSEDEIRSSVTIFRRLYMANEPGNFLKAAEAFARAVLPHPVGKWVQGVAAEYAHALGSVPDLFTFAQKSGATFTRKRLIDAFIYTQYAHQGDRRRERQYAECLAQVGGQEGVLFWLFLTGVWECALHVRNAGVQIASFTEQYCKCHAVTPSAVRPAAEYVGMGQMEKQRDREARIFREKAEELAATLWKDAGRPEGGTKQFLPQAREELRAAMGKTDVSFGD